MGGGSRHGRRPARLEPLDESELAGTGKWVPSSRSTVQGTFHPLQADFRGGILLRLNYPKFILGWRVKPSFLPGPQLRGTGGTLEGAAGLGEPVISGFQGGSEIICKVLKINQGGRGGLIKSSLGGGTDRAGS